MSAKPFSRLCLFVVLATGLGTLGCSKEEQAEKKPIREPDAWMRDVLGMGDTIPAEKPGPPPEGSLPENPIEVLNKLEGKLSTLGQEGLPENEKEREEFLQLLRTGVRIARTARRPELIGKYLIATAMLYQSMGHLKPGLDACEEVSRLVWEKESSWPVAARLLQGDLFRQQGTMNGALAAYEQAFDLAAERGDWERAERAFLNLQGLFTIDENLPGLKSAIDSRERRLSSTADPNAEARVAFWKCLLALQEQRVGQALSELAEAVGYLEEAGSAALKTFVDWSRAEILIQQEAFDDAILVFQGALQEAEQLGVERLAARLHVRLADVLYKNWSAYNMEQAFQHYRLGIQAADRLGMDALAIKALTFLGQDQNNHQRLRPGTACLLEARKRTQTEGTDEELKTALENAFRILRERFDTEEKYNDFLQSVEKQHEEFLQEALNI